MNKFNLELENLSEEMERNGFEFGSGFDEVLSHYRHRILELIVADHNNGSVLEVGGATGLGTTFLEKHFQELEVLEPVSKYVNILRSKFRNVPVYQKTLEEHWEQSEKKYDWIVAFNVLEHVDNAKIFLRCAYDLMKDNGRLVLTVPNSDSLHRQLGCRMGIISNLNELAESDKMIGHKRYYNNDKIKSELIKAGFRLMWTMGNFLKPFPNEVMEKIDEKCYEGLHKLGGSYKFMAAELFALAIKKGQ